MKVRHLFFALVFLGLLSACGRPQPPAEATATLTPEASSTPAPTSTLPPIAPPTSRMTITVEASRTPKSLPSATASLTPGIPNTPTSPYPVGVTTPIPDPGFLEIIPENVAQLTPIFKIAQQSIWQSAASRDGQLLFVGTNNGMFLYNRQGQELASWPSMIVPNLPCEACMSINSDGSRFALATHKDGKWFAQVYNVYENVPTLLLEKPINAPVRGIVNEVRVAISPDGLLLAYGAAEGDTLLIDMNNSQTLLTNQGGADSATFSPDGAYFVIRRGRLLLFWKTPVWKNPANLQLPEENTPYAFSPDGKRLAIASTDNVRAYALDTLALKREIPIPTPKDLTRAWKITFLDDKILAGYNARWNSAHTKATIDVAQWNLDTGETLQMATNETDSPDALSALWGANISLTKASSGPVTLSQYNVFRFVDQDQLLVNSLHSACWLTLSSGATTCYDNPKFKVLSSQTEPYLEIRQERSTLIQRTNGDRIFELEATYPILAVNLDGKYFLVNVNDATTDVYFESRKSGFESLPGSLLTYTENAQKIVFNTMQRSGQGWISMVDKGQLKTTYQKKADFMLKPLALTADNKVYFLQQDVGQQQVFLKVITPPTFAITNLARLTLPAEPQVMSISEKGVFAFGLQDGSVSIVSPDGLQVGSFQAVYTPISGISLTPDGRYLAVASEDGIRIYAVVP